MNCALDKKETDTLFGFLKGPKSKLKKLFLDWTPEAKPHLPTLGEIKTLEFLIVRGCELEDQTFKEMLTGIKNAGIKLKLLDVYSNKLTDESVQFLGGFVNDYKSLDSIGFGLNRIKRLSSLQAILDKVGTVDSTKAEFDSFTAANKNREAIIAKNLKLKAAKKPEEPLPYLEEVYLEEGTGKYLKKQWPNLHYLNLVGNPLEPEPETPFLEAAMRRAPGLHVILSNTKAEKWLDQKLVETLGGRLYLK